MVNELLDAIIEMIDKEQISWRREYSFEKQNFSYIATLPNDATFSIEPIDNADSTMKFGKWEINSLDYPRLLDLLNIVKTEYEKRNPEYKETETIDTKDADFFELKSLVDKCIENDTPRLPFDYAEEKERFMSVMDKCFVGINKISSWYFGLKNVDDLLWSFELRDSCDALWFLGWSTPKTSSHHIGSLDKLFSDLVLNHFNEGTEDVTNKITKYYLLLSSNRNELMLPSIFKFAVGYVENKLVVSWNKFYDEYFQDAELSKYYYDLEVDNN